MANRGGFSWKRLLGLTRAKQKLSRKLGIPLTKSGRQRKLGKQMGGCMVVFTVMAVTVLLFFSLAVYVLAQ
jgi:hypothetical protein